MGRQPTKTKQTENHYPFQNKNLTPLPNEEWKSLPGFDENYLISNFGRIKALSRLVNRPPRNYWTKERIISTVVHRQLLKTKKREQQLVECTISYERKKYSVKIARWVYYLFAGPFNLSDRKLIITYKDGNSLNLHFSNLVLTNHSDVMYEAYRKENRKREAFSNKPKKIIQLNKHGEVIRHFLSINEASAFLGIHSNTISEVVAGKRKQYKGFIFKKRK